MIYRKLIPSSLLGRSLIIVFIPVIILVIITTSIFYQTSWNIISKRLSQSVVADINVIVKLIDSNLKFKAFRVAKEDFKMKLILLDCVKVDEVTKQKKEYKWINKSEVVHYPFHKVNHKIFSILKNDY